MLIGKVQVGALLFLKQPPEERSIDTGLGGTGGETLKGGSRCSSIGSTGSGGPKWFGVLGLLVAFVRGGEQWASSS